MTKSLSDIVGSYTVVGGLWPSVIWALFYAEEPETPFWSLLNCCNLKSKLWISVPIALFTHSTIYATLFFFKPIDFFFIHLSFRSAYRPLVKVWFFHKVLSFFIQWFINANPLMRLLFGNLLSIFFFYILSTYFKNLFHRNPGFSRYF